MTVTITIKCDNAAFDHCGDEVSRILRRLTEHIGTAGLWEREHFDELHKHPLMDFNGNRVGSVTVSE